MRNLETEILKTINNLNISFMKKKKKLFTTNTNPRKNTRKNQEKKYLKSFHLLPLSIYFYKTVTISKYQQFSMYKLNKNIVGIR